jgi:hypothetical protein
MVLYANTGGQSIKFYAGGGGLIGTFSNTGLAVTGLITASSATGSNQLKLQGSGQNGMKLATSTGAAGLIVGRSYYSDDANDFFIYNEASSSLMMRIDSSGNVGIGVTPSTGDKFVVDQGGNASASQFKNSSGTANAQCVVAWHANTTGDNVFHQFYTEASATLRGSITYNRAGGLTVFNTTSDYRAKDIIGPVVDSGTLIDSVPVYMGKMKGATQERPMFIAHETPTYAHTGEKDAVDAEGKPVYQQIDTSTLVPVLWAEIQALRQRVAALESK